MYLSRVEIDIKNRRKIHDLTHLGAYHSWVEESFPEEINKGERTRKLWRIDHLNGKSYLLIVSINKPDLKRLEKYGVPGSAETKDYDNYLNNIKSGETYLFRLVVNPVHSVIENKDSTRGRVYPLVTVPQQMEYLKKRAEKCGFSLKDDEYRIVERKYEILRKSHHKPVKLSKVAFEGKLMVRDADVFKRMLVTGMGRERAYGCGMMTIIPEVK